MGIGNVSWALDSPPLASGGPPSEGRPVCGSPGVCLFSSSTRPFPPSPAPRPGAAFILHYVLIPALEGWTWPRVTLLPGPAQHPPGPGWSPCSLAHPMSHGSSRRGSFLVPLLRECFRDLGWLATICHTGGDVGLLVTSIVPRTPFFWAMHVTEVWACWWPAWARCLLAGPSRGGCGDGVQTSAF